MTQSSCLVVQKAILDRLSGHFALKALMGDPVRIYDQKPDDSLLPFAHFERHQIKPLCDEEGFEEHLITLSLHSDFEGSEEIKSLLPQIRLALEYQGLESDQAIMGPVRVVFMDVFRSTDGRRHYGLLRLRLSLEPLSTN